MLGQLLIQLGFPRLGAGFAHHPGHPGVKVIGQPGQATGPQQISGDHRGVAALARGFMGCVQCLQTQQHHLNAFGIQLSHQFVAQARVLWHRTAGALALVGTGCYERDGGLSGFGREIVAEMNRVGIMCDLSHVGSKTSEEVILESKKPVCYSHCLPSGLKEHPRNKSDEELKFIADHGGFVGVTMFAPFLAKGIDSTIDDYAEAIEYTMNIVGEDAIGIGTDFTQGHGQDFFEMLTHDKGYARRLTSFGKIINPLGIRTVGEFPNLTETLLKRGHSERVVRKIMGENWVNVLKDVWGE